MFVCSAASPTKSDPPVGYRSVGLAASSPSTPLTARSSLAAQVAGTDAHFLSCVFFSGGRAATS